MPPQQEQAHVLDPLPSMVPRSGSLRTHYCSNPGARLSLEVIPTLSILTWVGTVQGDSLSEASHFHATMAASLMALDPNGVTDPGGVCGWAGPAA